MQCLDLLISQGIARDHDLETVVVRRVMAAREHHPRLACQHMRGVIQRRGRHQPNIANLAATVCHALDQAFDQLRA